MTLWEVDLHPKAGQPDLLARQVAAQAADLGLAGFRVHAARGFLVQGAVDAPAAQQMAQRLLADLVVERPLVAVVGDPRLTSPPPGAHGSLVHVLPLPGVTDPVAASTLAALAEINLAAEAVVTLRKYWIDGLTPAQLQTLAEKLLANGSIERTVFGPLVLDHITFGAAGKFELQVVPLRELDDAALQRLSRERTLSLTLVEMQTIQQHYRTLGREPTDAELETIAQTWSEHCSHKTLTGRVHYRDERGERRFQNLLKETIFAATVKIREQLGSRDWCVSVFRDNAGVVTFDEQHHIAFKVETHNRPSAIEPYGGANTGVGGVIRDTLGTGLGAKPICNTDVFCFAPPDTPPGAMPPGVLHPRRVFRGVVAGVRDYGNRMGIPTVNGAICFDPRYIGNPLVFCGNVGLIPVDKAVKQTQPNDLIVALGGRTGRDGIHGATFSSVELDSNSEKVSGGAVQIGNAVVEKMTADVLLAARDEGLFTAVTDCGAGGFSSAVGEMGAELGAEVWLERAPLKYEGLSYCEIWISEAQERMVCSVPEANWPRLEALCRSEGVEATVIGRFTPTGRLTLKYQGQTVGELSMEFLHEGRPKVERQAVYTPQRGAEAPVRPRGSAPPGAAAGSASPAAASDLLLKVLASWNVASKEWVIRQYDHEVQGGSVIKPLTGAANDGPSDAAVLRPVLGSRRGIVVGCGINPRYADFDPYDMAASAIDEAVRNCVAVGADPAKLAILDNFCWGYTDRPETLGALVRAALACYDVAVAYGTPFISGKDSLNNEYSYDADGQRRTIQIPPTLLISALGQVNDVRHCVTMDLKAPGNLLYLVGPTAPELGGSQLHLVTGECGGAAPKLDPALGRRIHFALHAAMQAGLVRACHDLSEGGLAAAMAEMCLGGRLGAQLQLASAPRAGDWSGLSPPERDRTLLFSESNCRYLVEVSPPQQAAFEQALAAAPCARIGAVTAAGLLQIAGEADLAGGWLVDCEVEELARVWRRPLEW